MKPFFSLLAGILLVLLTGCLKTPSSTPTPTDDSVIPDNPTEMTDLVIDPTFDYATTVETSVALLVAGPQGAPIARRRVLLYTADPEDGGALLATGVTNQQGEWTGSFPLPTHQTELIAQVHYPGIPHAYRLSLEAGSHQYQLGGQTPGEGSNVAVLDQEIETGAGKMAGTNGVADKLTYMGTYNSQGVPSYLTPSPDIVTQEILDLVANSLPEGEQVPVNNPQYIAESISADTRLVDSAEVWVTFVHEGAGYRNVLGYYTYDLANPPSSVDDIDSLHIIFPNVSFIGGGGGLSSGDKVYLGSFSPNTGVGWFLVPNAWSSSSQVVNYPGTQSLKFSDKDLNTFISPALRSHVVLLKNDARELLLLGMEDIDRDSHSCDQDFNDAVFYITASPYSAIATDSVAEAQVATGDDTDGDEIIDENDDYPNDPNRAFDLFFPAENVYGTVAYEDLWPFRGDYDMNDVVIDYNYEVVTNTANRVVELNGTFIVKALGAGMTSGFGFELNVDPSTISSATGSQLFNNTVTLAANGLEANQGNAVMIVFDDGHQLMDQGAGRFVNTEVSDAYITPDTVRVTLIFNTPQRLNDLGSAPFNPFIFTQRGRGYEVHLPDHAPTDLADLTLFKTGNDDSDQATDRFYKDPNHLPWAIHIPSPFDYPVEQAAIIQGHLRFSNWAQGRGTSYTDWYESKSGYRNNVNLYPIP